MTEARKAFYFIVALLLVSTSFPQRSIAATYAQAPVGQPTDERSAQDTLPKSNDPIWHMFAECRVNYNQANGIYSLDMTSTVKDLDGKDVSITGFILPIDGSDHTKHFLLTRNTPVCFFCRPGQPNEVVEVVSPRAVAWTDDMVTVKGKMSLINYGEKGLFFKVAAAHVK